MPARRRISAGRVTLGRREWVLETRDGSTVRMKAVDAPGESRAKPEFDDVVAEARRTGRPAHAIAREIHAIASKETE